MFGAISIQPSGLSPFREEARRPRRPATKRRLSAPRFLTAQRPVTLTGAGRFHSRPEAGWPPVRGHRGGVGALSQLLGSAGPTASVSETWQLPPHHRPPHPGVWGGGGPVPHGRRGAASLRPGQTFRPNFPASACRGLGGGERPRGEPAAASGVGTGQMMPVSVIGGWGGVGGKGTGVGCRPGFGEGVLFCVFSLFWLLLFFPPPQGEGRREALGQE